MNLKKLFIPLVLFIALLSGGKLNAQSDLGEAQAMFIYNFLAHIKWPDADLSNKYVIGVYGKTTTTLHLKKYTSNRMVGNRPIEVVEYTDLAQVKGCNVLLIAETKSSQLATATAQLKGKSCLIISEKEGATAQGAAIAFQVSEGKLRYKLSEKNASEHNLYVSRALTTMSL